MSTEHLPPLNPLGTFCFSCFFQWAEQINRALNSSETVFPLPLFNNILPDTLSTRGLHPYGFPKASNWGITESQDKAVLFLPSIWAQIPPRSLCQSLVWAGSGVIPRSRCNPGFCSDCLPVLLLSLLHSLLCIQAQMCKILAMYKVVQVYYQYLYNSSSLCVWKIYSRFLWALLF